MTMCCRTCAKPLHPSIEGTTHPGCDLDGLNLEAAALEAMSRRDWEAAELNAGLAEAHGERPELRGSALWYANRGIPIFPLQPYSKRPFPGSHGFKDATTDIEQVRLWWDCQPGANIGIPTGIMFDVIDTDTLEAWLQIKTAIATHVIQPIGIVVTARTIGRHIYIEPTGEGNKTDWPVRGCDYRGQGGYVVAPPSFVHETKTDGREYAGRYTWQQPLITLNQERQS